MKIIVNKKNDTVLNKLNTVSTFDLGNGTVDTILANGLIQIDEHIIPILKINSDYYLLSDINKNTEESSSYIIQLNIQESDLIKITNADSTPIPTGTELDILTFDENNVLVAKPFGWRQWSDLPGPPPFENGVAVITNQSGEYIQGFVEISLDGADTNPKANTIPLYTPGENGQLKVADPVGSDDAVNLSYLNIRLPLPPETGSYTLQSVNGTVGWVTTP